MNRLLFFLIPIVFIISCSGKLGEDNQHYSSQDTIQKFDTLRVYSPNNKLKEFALRKNGVKNGLCILYHDNGTVQRYGNMTDGKEDGYFFEYDSLRRMLKANYYENGKLLRELDISDYLFKQYSFNLFRIKAPSSWEKREPNDQVVGFIKHDELNFPPNVTVATVVMPENVKNISLDELQQNGINLLKKKFETYKIFSEKKMTGGGITSYYTEYSCIIENKK